MMGAPEGNTNAASRLKPYEPDLAKTLPPESDMGPAMRALPERWRVFAMSSIVLGVDYTHVEAAKMAGYEGTDGSLRVQAHKLAHDPRIRAAIIECSKAYLQDGVPRALSVLMSQLDHDDPKIRQKAASTLLDRGGMPAVSQVEHKDVTPLSQEEKIELAVRLAERLGLDPAKLVGAMAAPNVPREPLTIEQPKQGDTDGARPESEVRGEAGIGGGTGTGEAPV